MYKKWFSTQHSCLAPDEDTGRNVGLLIQCSAVEIKETEETNKSMCDPPPSTKQFNLEKYDFFCKFGWEYMRNDLLRLASWLYKLLGSCNAYRVSSIADPKERM